MEKRAYIFSASLHLLVGLLLLAKLPFLHAKPLSLPAVISVEIVSISALTQSPPKKAKPQEVVAKTKMETHRAAQNKPAPTPTPVEKKPIPQLDKVVPKPVPAPKPLEKQSSEKPLKHEAKPQKKPDAKPEKKVMKNEDDFMSVLQAVNDVKRTAPRPTTNDDKTIDSENISDKLSISEMDALRQQLQRCWNIPAGSLNAKDLAVDIRVTMGPDAIVKQADILDQSRMNQDHYFRTAAESAKRALFSPHCTPLKLPKSSYEKWQTFVITFNPKDMI